MWALTKFERSPEPVLFGITNTGYARDILRIPGVQWVQVITGTGFAVRTSPADEERMSPLLPPVTDPTESDGTEKAPMYYCESDGLTHTSIECPDIDGPYSPIMLPLILYRDILRGRNTEISVRLCKECFDRAQEEKSE